MSLESVRNWLAVHAPDLRLIETHESTATVDSAARALGVEPGRIAKTLAVRAGERLFLLVARGDARLDNRKCKDELGARPRMLGAEETLEMTGHPVGGVCPFGLKTPPPRLSRPVATGFRHCLSGGRIAQHLGRGERRPAVRAGGGTVGRPMPPARASGLKQPLADDLTAVRQADAFHDLVVIGENGPAHVLIPEGGEEVVKVTREQS